MAEENKNIEVEQINQNYLIEPSNLYSSEEEETDKNVTIDYPESDVVSIKANEVREIDADKLKAPDSILKAESSSESIEKNLKELSNSIKASYDPAIKNLYNTVSALTNKRTSPTSFTDERTIFNGGIYFFQDETSRVMEKLPWA